MFDFTNVTVLYMDVLLSVFSVIILMSALVFLPVGIWALKTVKKNVWGAVVSFVLFLLTLLCMSYKGINLDGIFYTNIFADIFLGAAVGFLVAIIVIKYRQKKV